MRILAISNLYPPHIIGGYEIACRDFCEGLAGLGHQIEVLTSKYGLSNESNSPNSSYSKEGQAIKRLLNFNNPQKTKNSISKKWLGIKSVYFDLANFWVTFCEILRFKPDVVYIWNLAFVSLSPIIAAIILKKKIVFHLEDYWLGAALRFYRSQNQGIIEECIKKVLTHLVYQKIVEAPFIAVSEHVKQYYQKQGMQGQNTVIYNGLARSFFVYPPKPKTGNQKTLLYVGRVVEDKGVRLIIEAMKILKEQGFNDLRLDIVGTGEEEYVGQLKKMILDYGLSGQVNFLSQKSHEETVKLYSLYLIIVVSSIWDEPFGLVAIEAMASGCVPIVSDSGALTEIVEDGKNGLVFQKGESKDLADKIKDLLQNKPFIDKLSHAAFSSVRQQFSLKEKVKEVEGFLTAITAGS